VGRIFLSNRRLNEENLSDKIKALFNEEGETSGEGDIDRV
jgi:hypothetical protein